MEAGPLKWTYKVVTNTFQCQKITFARVSFLVHKFRDCLLHNLPYVLPRILGCLQKLLRYLLNFNKD